MSMDHPNGTFNDTEIIDTGIGKSGDKETPHVFVVFKTTHGEITGYFYLTEKSATYTMEKLVNMGVPADAEWDDIVGGIASGELLSGKLCQVVIADETYNDKTRAKIQNVRPNNYQGGPSRSEDAVGNVKKFGALWRQIQPRKSAKTTVEEKPIYSPDDDDCPF